MLLRFFLDQFAKQYQVESPALSADAMQTLCEHPWPGNVRELKNVVERLVVRAKNGEIGRDDLPLEVLRSAPARRSRGTRDAGDAPRGRHAVRADGERRRVVLVVRLRAVHGARPHARRPADDRQEGAGANVGNYKVMVELFNMPADDYKRFLGFLAQVPVPHAVSAVPVGGDEPRCRDGSSRRQVAWPRPPETRRTVKQCERAPRAVARSERAGEAVRESVSGV